MESLEASEEWMKGLAEVMHFMFAFADSMAIKCAVELRIPDIIRSHDGPITLSQIASSIDSPSPDIPYLARIMRLLVHRKVFTADYPSDGGDALYGLTRVSGWLFNDSDWSLAPMFLMENHPWLTAPWHCFGQCVKEGDSAFKKAHGTDQWDFASKNPEFNKIFNDAMACTSGIETLGFLTGYKDGFSSTGSLVDVGGGTGGFIAQLVKSYPHIKGLNFDLPHVVATAPEHDGVSHVVGDMFEGVPSADAVIMKRVLHDWGDKDCVKILKNCRKAIPEKTGKVILVEVVLQPDGDGMFGEVGLLFDLVMMAHTSGGKERTEPEWKKLLEGAGFPRYKITKIPAIPCIIEWVLHDWGDEDCVKILKNCRRAIPEKTGKVILVEVVLQPDGDGMFGEVGLLFDLVMMAHTSGGKERTEPEWKKLLEGAGFPRYKITKIPAIPCIIEAYPE